MKIKILVLHLLLCILLILTPIQQSIAAPLNSYCSGSSCNWLDPKDTDCWDDAYSAGVAYYSNMYNYNRYSPGCVANWSYTGNTSATWLAAETYGVYTFHGDQPWAYVWNNMWDGSSTVCTRGAIGSSERNYYGYTAYICG